MALAIDGTVGNGSATSGTSIAITLTTTSTNDVICVGVIINGTTVSGISDVAGLTWARRAIATIAGSPNDGVEFWYAVAPNALSADVITLNMTGSASFIAAAAFGISGADTSTIFDSHAGLPDVSTTTPSDPRTVSTTNANTVIIGVFRQNGNGSPTAGAGYTGVNTSNFLLLEYKIVAAAQTNLSVTDGAALDSNGGIGDAIFQASTDTLLGQACL